ncbi:TetR/AcrR family transcriptional regulator C-terminal domain-containing protein [Streptomyces sp. NPDC046909]|uniref:TetR/AcrR family transcriptional regulator C-terminal domain-containing protein n=1 Tax=Streptomyces sp. NPDC046909 TaxID=3155617 RepID=UPI0033E96798
MSKTSSSTESRGPALRAHVGLTKAQIIAAAMDLLDEDGLDKLSLRAVAGRLGVRVNAVAWHVKDKSSLISAVTDAMMAHCVPSPLPEDPEERVRALLTALRTTLRSHRDGARLAREGFSLDQPHQLAFAEAFNTALHATGRTPQAAAWTAWTLVYFTIGLVREEQTPPHRTLCAQAAAADPADFPSLAATIKHLTAESFDDRFAFGVDLILTGHSAAPATAD